MAAKLFSLVVNATKWTWLEVAVILEGIEVDIDTVRHELRKRVDMQKTVQENINSLCKKASDSEDVNVISFILNTPKKHPNCVGVSLVTLLVADALHQEAEMYASETHTWCEMNGERLDFKGNLAFAKRASKPLTMYTPAIHLNAQEKCILLLTNKNQLPDTTLAPLLLRLYERDLVDQPWSIAKLIILHELVPTAVLNTLLAAQPHSLQCQFIGTLYYIDSRDIPPALQRSRHLLQLQTERAHSLQTVDNEFFTLHLKTLMEELCKALHDTPTTAAEASYNTLTQALFTVAQQSMERDTDYKDFMKSVPTWDGKRRLL
jgi:hypothetical protein